MKKPRKELYLEVIAILAFLVIGAGVPILVTYEKPDYFEIESDKDFRKYKFPGNGSLENPYIIENFTISEAQKRAISIRNTNSYFIIRNCSLSYNFFGGIRLENIRPGTAKIYDNFINGHSVAGIHAKASNQVEIYNNILIENERGILVENSSNCIITNNEIYVYRPADRFGTQKRGIVIEDSDNIYVMSNYFRKLAYGIKVLFCNDIILSNNTFDSLTHIDIELLNCTQSQITNSQSSNNGILFINLIYSNENSVFNCTSMESSNSMRIDSSNFNSVLNNTFLKNFSGITILGENQENLILYNEFINCTNEGVSITDGDSNIIHHNSFFYNNLGDSSQAEDNGINNSWFDIDLSEGNFWNGWNVSLPYLISGSANSTDPFPLSIPI